MAAKIKNDLFNIWMLDPEDPVDESMVNLDYVLQLGNLFQVKEVNGLLRVLVPCQDQLPKIEKLISNDNLMEKGSMYYFDNVEIPKIDLEEFWICMRYFQAIYDKRKSEAAVYLLYHNVEKKWKIYFVLQTDASGGRVVYISPEKTSLEEYVKVFDTEEALDTQVYINEEYNKLYNEGWRIYGTIHSHCNFDAYHSNVDDHDEKDFDGLHITIGKVRSGWDFSARFMISGHAVKMKIEDVVHGTVEEISNPPEIKIDNFYMDLMKEPFPPPAIVHTGNRWESEWDGNKLRAHNLLDKTRHWSDDLLFGKKDDEDDKCIDDVYDLEYFEEEDFVRLYDHSRSQVLWFVRDDYEDEDNARLFDGFTEIKTEKE